MYQRLLTFNYFLLEIPALILIIRFRNVPWGRRLVASLGIAGGLFMPKITGGICDLLSEIAPILLAIGFIMLMAFLVIKCEQHQGDKTK